ncbi:MAG: VOC family protein [Hyphomicrobiaceae bacterium]
MSKQEGRFLWYDLMTTDTEAALSFYGSVFGWDGVDSGVPGQCYTVLSKAGVKLGGLMPIPQDAAKAGIPPSWMGYVGVGDVDDFVKRIEAAGGHLHKGPMDVPGVLRFAVVSDPSGAGFIIFSGFSREPTQTMPPGTPGHVDWRELHSGEVDSTFAFYSGLFGWQKGDLYGPYQLFTYGGEAVGGMMKKGADVPASGWLFYFNVEALDAGIDRVKAGGGQIVHGPMEVPGGAWIAQCLDPQGAMFAIVSAQR